MWLSKCLPAAGNSEGNFGMNLNGELKVLKNLDREEVPAYSLIIKASSNSGWTPPKGQRAARAKALDPALDPSLLEVRIELEDINDQTPRFTKAEYTAGPERSSSVCVSVGRVFPVYISLIRHFRSRIKCQIGDGVDQGPGHRQRHWQQQFGPVPYCNNLLLPVTD